MSILRHPLNKGRRSAAIYAWISWHFRSRLSEHPLQIPFVDDTHLIVEPGMTGATGNIYFGLSEWVDMAFVLHSLRPEDLFLDVGANVGSYALLAAGGAGAQVMAAEPIQKTYNRLVRNVESNGLQNRIQTHQIGLSDQAGTLTFTSDLDTMNRVVAPDPHDSLNVESCPVLTMDTWVGDQRPTMMKIDVEGHETDVAKGSCKVLADPSLKAVVVETALENYKHDRSLRSASSCFQEFGFRPFDYAPQTRTLTPLEEQVRGNVIFVRDIVFVRDRLKSAPRHTLSFGRVI